MASLEDLLMYKLQEDAASVPSEQTAVLTGAGLGAVPGLLVGNAAHQAGNNVNKLLNRAHVSRFAPGNRMAGGLVGAILGGALGAGVRNMMVETSPAATLLAKLQSGTFTESDQLQLARVLEDTYQQMGLR